MIIPARSASWAVIGEKRVFRCSTTVSLPTASTESTGESSLARVDRGKVRCRSSEILTACALNCVPSLNLIPVRSLIVTVFLSAPEKTGRLFASCGTISVFEFRS